MSLRAQIAAKQMEVAAMTGFATSGNPDLVRAQRELSALRSEAAKFERGSSGGTLAEVPLEKIPAAGLEYLRRVREVKYREALLEYFLE